MTDLYGSEPQKTLFGSQIKTSSLLLLRVNDREADHVDPATVWFNEILIHGEQDIGRFGL